MCTSAKALAASNLASSKTALIGTAASLAEGALVLLDKVACLLPPLLVGHGLGSFRSVLHLHNALAECFADAHELALSRVHAGPVIHVVAALLALLLGFLSGQHAFVGKRANTIGSAQQLAICRVRAHPVVCILGIAASLALLLGLGTSIGRSFTEGQRLGVGVRAAAKHVAVEETAVQQDGLRSNGRIVAFVASASLMVVEIEHRCRWRRRESGSEIFYKKENKQQTSENELHT